MKTNDLGIKEYDMKWETSGVLQCRVQQAHFIQFVNNVAFFSTGFVI